MFQTQILYQPIKAHQERLRVQHAVLALIPKPSLRADLALWLHKFADRLEPKPLILNCETCS